MVQNQWDHLVPALQRGNFDIILNGLEITDEHRQQIAMSRPYYVYAQQIVTRKDTDGLTHWSCSKAIRRQLSGTVAQRLWNSWAAWTSASIPARSSRSAISTQRVDAVLLDLPIALYYLPKEPGLKRSGDPFAPGYYGIGVRAKEDASLLAALNQAIGELLANGTLERIYRSMTCGTTTRRA